MPPFVLCPTSHGEKSRRGWSWPLSAQWDLSLLWLVNQDLLELVVSGYHLVGRLWNCHLESTLWSSSCLGWRVKSFILHNFVLSYVEIDYVDHFIEGDNKCHKVLQFYLMYKTSSAYIIFNKDYLTKVIITFHLHMDCRGYNVQRMGGKRAWPPRKSPQKMG